MWLDSGQHQILDTGQDTMPVVAEVSVHVVFSHYNIPQSSFSKSEECFPKANKHTTAVFVFYTKNMKLKFGPLYFN